MEMIIKNNSGQFWTGNCWGVKDAATIYDTIGDCPEELPAESQDPDDTLIRDGVYYYWGDNTEAEAGIKEI